MADVVTPEVRSRMMAGIGPSDTKPELAIRRGLHSLGYRFRLGRGWRKNGRLLPGKPDLVFPGRRAVILINGCFWHGHDCHLFRWPGSRKEFWRTKLSGNIIRDRRVREALLADGWRMLEVWECTLKGRVRRPLDQVLGECSAFLEGDATHAAIGGAQTVTIDEPE